MRSYPRHGTLERLPATAADEGLPELDVGFCDWVRAADHLSGEPGPSKGFWLDRAI
jgi:hypothetical protein